MIEQITLHAEGMTCTGCETRIENTIKKLDGVIYIKADYNSQNVSVTFDSSKLDEEIIVQAIEGLDYKVTRSRAKASDAHSADTTHTTNETNNVAGSRDNSTNKNGIIQAVSMVIILLALYLIIDKTIGFNFIPEINQSMGYGILFVVGLLTSVHCIGMCGGINMSVCMQYKQKADESKFGRLKPSALYNLGRVISYTVVGGIAGGLGAAVSFTGRAKGIIAVISGIFMIIMGLNMLNIFPWLRRLNPRLPKFLGRKVHSSAGQRGPLIVGLLNGLMPCGPLQAMQLYALGTGSVFAGALSMFLFSMGTFPLMFGFGAISTLLSGKFTHRMMKVSAALVLVLGVIMINRGLNLSGFGFTPSNAQSQGAGNIARIENGVQYVSTELEPGRYSPIVVQEGIPVKWTINVEKGDLNGCNNPIMIPQLNQQKKLVVGKNVIEFTPDKAGDIIYTCWMGMISSKIRVVEDIGQVTEEDIAGEPDNPLFPGIEAPSIPIDSVDEMAVAEIKEDGKQYVSINVNEREFSPAVIVLQELVETVWVINGVELSDSNRQVYFPEYNAVLTLQEEENVLTLIPEFDFTFMNGTATMNGYVKVVEDINNIDREAIKEEIENYEPVPWGYSGGMSCH